MYDLNDTNGQLPTASARHGKPSGDLWLQVGVVIMAILFLITIAYVIVVPWVSRKSAELIPVALEKQIGDGAFDALDYDDQIDTARTRLVSEFFSQMKISSDYPIRISVVNSSELNAFALPGGRIVLYSALLDELESAPELAAVLAHEFTHIERRHATRSIFQKLGSQLFVNLIVGKMGSMVSEIAERADEMRTLTYSRTLEKEADLRGLKLLVDRGIDPQGFIDLFDRLRSTDELNLPEFMTSHPDLNKRIDYIKDSSMYVRLLPQPALDAIFNQLNP